jgi:hypothetical protein
MLKIFELGIYHDFQKVAYEVDKISRLQRGFVQRMKTLMAIKNIIEFHGKMIKKFKNNKKEKILVFLDLRKAYDIVNTDVLLEKLDYFEIASNILNLLKNIFNKSKICYNGI